MNDVALPAASRAAWLNRSTLGVALASLFSDVSHELGTREDERFELP